MAQVQHRARSALDTGPRPFPSPWTSILEWQVSRVAVARESGAGWSAEHRDQMTAVLDAWRSAEHSLTSHLESGPERDRLRLQVAHLRAKYHCLFEAASDAPAGPSRRPTD